MDNYLRWIWAHEKIILVLAGFGVLLYIGNLYEGHRHDEAVAANSIAQQQLKDQVAKNVELAAQAQASQQAYSKLAAQVSTQNALIATQIAALQSKTQEQQKIDQNLSLADLALRWRTLINAASPQDVQAIGNTLSVSGQAGHETVNQLEVVDSLHQEVLAGHTVQDNLTSQINSCQAVNTAQTQQIAGLASQITDEKKACETQISILKSNERKSKIHWLIGGVIGGIVAALKLGI